MKNKMILMMALMGPAFVFGDDIEKGLSSYFSAHPKIKVSQIGPIYLLDGSVDQIQDLNRVNEVVEQLKIKGVAIKSFVDMSKEAKATLALQLEKQIGSPDINIVFVNERVFLEGVASSDYEADRAIEIVRANLFDGSTVRRPAQDSSGISTIVDMLRVRPQAPPPLALTKSKKDAKAPK